MSTETWSSYPPLGDGDIGLGSTSPVPNPFELGWTNEPLAIRYGNVQIDYTQVTPDAHPLVAQLHYSFVDAGVHAEAELPTDIMRRRIVDFFGARSARLTHDVGFLTLGVTELADNALKPRDYTNPEEMFGSGWCEFWLCDPADTTDKAAYVLLATTVSKEDCKSTTSKLGHPNPAEALMAIEGDAEHGRGVLLAAAYFQEEKVEARVLHVPIGDSQDYMAIILRVPL